jgi:hypothetical protein
MCTIIMFYHISCLPLLGSNVAGMFLPTVTCGRGAKNEIFLDCRLCRFVPNRTRPRFDMHEAIELLLRTKGLCELRQV